jgi:hypothetical protein
MLGHGRLREIDKGAHFVKERRDAVMDRELSSPQSTKLALGMQAECVFFCLIKMEGWAGIDFRGCRRLSVFSRGAAAECSPGREPVVSTPRTLWSLLFDIRQSPKPDDAVLGS